MDTKQFRLKLILSVAALCIVRPGWAAEQNQEPNPSQSGKNPIVVIGQRPDLFLGILPDSELDENDIASYGFNTIGDLISQVSREVNLSGEGPVVLINGQLTNGINDIADLPTEAASQIQILPSTASARLGQSPTRRVINVVIKPNLAQVTGNGETGWSTRGDAWKGKAELNLLKLDNSNRRSIVFSAQREDGLLESDRAILPDPSAPPYAVAGNIIGIAGAGTEIDPALSALAGQLVTVAGVPLAIANPSLAQFAERANLPNASGAAPFRSLVDSIETYAINANITQRLDSDTSLSNSLRLDRSYSSGLSGLFQAFVPIPAASPFSPFGNDVQLASLLGEPLRRDQQSTSLVLGQTLNSRVASFSISASLSFSHRVARTETDRDYDIAALLGAVGAGTANPFGEPSPALLGAVRSDFSRARSDVGEARLTVSGPLFTLPTGQVRMTTRVGGKRDRFASSTQGVANNRTSALSRDEVNAQVNLQIPILPLGKIDIGAVSLDLTAGIRDVSSVGSLATAGGAINWSVGRIANIRFELSDEEVPTFGGILNDPQIVNENYRVFDFLREETVQVRYILGGNPDLPTQKQRVFKISGTSSPLVSGDLTLNAEYNRITGRNAASSLPPVNAEVQAAFPDRFIRNPDGVLVQVDARPVSFARDLAEYIIWGLDFQHIYGGTVDTGSESGAKAGGPSLGRGWRIGLRLDHTWYLTSERLARAGLAPIDLLAGGASVYGGGQQRHRVHASASAYHRGMGLQTFVDWNSRSVINSGTAAAPSQILFEPRLQVNMRAFANLGPQFPGAQWLKGARVTLEILNLLDSKTRVTDQNAAVPNRYQPFLLDPVGRAFKLSLRKVF